MMESTFYDILSSPAGDLRIVSNGEGLTGIYLEPHTRFVCPGERRDDRCLAAAREQLRAYFAGELFAFDLPLASRGTAFQMRVWEQLRVIPYGVTISYRELAMRVGNPAACRAVGAANGRNPLSIVVPCHRVIGSNGTLTGYAGGLHCKQWLLRHEANVCASRSRT